MRACTMVSARITRANRVQSISAMAAMTEVSPVPMTATSSTAKSTGGKAIQMSTSREITRSHQPPK